MVTDKYNIENVKKEIIDILKKPAFLNIIIVKNKPNINSIKDNRIRIVEEDLNTFFDCLDAYINDYKIEDSIICINNFIFKNDIFFIYNIINRYKKDSVDILLYKKIQANYSIKNKQLEDVFINLKAEKELESTKDIIINYDLLYDNEYSFVLKDITIEVIDLIKHKLEFITSINKRKEDINKEIKQNEDLKQKELSEPNSEEIKINNKYLVKNVSFNQEIKKLDSELSTLNENKKIEILIEKIPNIVKELEKIEMINFIKIEDIETKIISIYNKKSSLNPFQISQADILFDIIFKPNDKEMLLKSFKEKSIFSIDFIDYFLKINNNFISNKFNYYITRYTSLSKHYVNNYTNITSNKSKTNYKNVSIKYKRLSNSYLYNMPLYSNYKNNKDNIIYHIENRNTTSSIPVLDINNFLNSIDNYRNEDKLKRENLVFHVELFIPKVFLSLNINNDIKNKIIEYLKEVLENNQVIKSDSILIIDNIIDNKIEVFIANIFSIEEDFDIIKTTKYEYKEDNKEDNINQIINSFKNNYSIFFKNLMSEYKENILKLTKLEVSKLYENLRNQSIKKSKTDEEKALTNKKYDEILSGLTEEKLINFIDIQNSTF